MKQALWTRWPHGRKSHRVLACLPMRWRVSSQDNRQWPPGSESVSRQMEQEGLGEGGIGAGPCDVQRPSELKRLRSWGMEIGCAVPEFRAG